MAGELSRAAVPALLALFAACGAGDAGPEADAGPEQVREAERYGGTAVVLLSGDLQPLNPLMADLRGNLQLHQFALFTPLLRYDAELNPLPGLAERWDTVRVTPDTLQLTFHLRRDVRWHDGTPTTADDVVFTFQRLKDPRTASPHAEMVRRYGPRVERIDSFTVRFRVRAAADFLVPWMTRPPVPAHLLRDAPPEALSRHPYGQRPVGNGPFRFVRRVPGQEWVFEANEAYPEALGGRPYLDRVVFRVVPDATSRLTELLSGSADVAGAPFVRADELRATPGVRVMAVSDGTWDYVGWNLRLPLFRDARVRRALALALDREAIARAVTHGYGRAGRTTVTPIHWSYDDADPSLTLPHDPAGAVRLLAGAGWQDRDGDGIVEDASGRPFRFTLKVPAGYAAYNEAAVIVQAQLRRVGVDAVLQQVELNTLIDQLVGRANARGGRDRDFEAVVLGWVDGPFSKDDSQYLHTRVMDEPNGQAGYSNPRADWLMDTLGVTIDRDAARPLWRELQRLIALEQPYTVLYYPDALFAVRDRLQGVEMDARGYFISIARWWIPPARRGSVRRQDRASAPQPAASPRVF
ncbi:MAG TPA: ABC transporter substrate-binding protein [Longimicrobiaceae bacterium]|nr:ABC transporter substrate-binding protein [Longimicrobiaceae bacterium]